MPALRAEAVGAGRERSRVLRRNGNGLQRVHLPRGLRLEVGREARQDARPRLERQPLDLEVRPPEDPLSRYLDAIRKLYPHPAWAVFSEVRSATGDTEGGRRADF